VLIAGPCVIESESTAAGLAGELAVLAKRLRVPFIFQGMYDKATHIWPLVSGPGLEEGLRILAAIKTRLSVPILTDIHEPAHAAVAARSRRPPDPAFSAGRPISSWQRRRPVGSVNIKKGQFLAPDDMKHAVAKVTGQVTLALSSPSAHELRLP